MENKEESAESKEDVRNITTFVHVDDVKTTLADAIFKQGKVFRDNRYI